MPRPLEWMAIALLLAGVVWSVKRHSDGRSPCAPVDVGARTPAH
jgi:hypothetical protein